VIRSRASIADGSLALVGAPRAEGVSRFVYTSVTPALSSWSPFVRYKRQVEDAVRRSGMASTILQPSAFMQTHFGRVTGWDLAAGKAVMVGDGSVPCRYVDVGDVARFAVLALERPELAGSEMPLAGPEALSRDRRCGTSRTSPAAASGSSASPWA